VPWIVIRSASKGSEQSIEDFFSTRMDSAADAACAGFLHIQAHLAFAAQVAVEGALDAS
jgi:hypothetical protein